MQDLGLETRDRSKGETLELEGGPAMASTVGELAATSSDASRWLPRQRFGRRSRVNCDYCT